MGHNRWLLSHHRVVISPEGIDDRSEFRQSWTAWRAVERVVQNGDYAFVYVSAVSGIIVPRRAFTPPASLEEFVRTATDYHGRAGA